jgi:hypothetical protein
MRGPCNAVLDKRMQGVLRRWARQRDKWQPRPTVDPRWRRAPGGPAAFDDDDLPLWVAA